MSNEVFPFSEKKISFVIIQFANSVTDFISRMFSVIFKEVVQFFSFSRINSFLFYERLKPVYPLHLESVLHGVYSLGSGFSAPMRYLALSVAIVTLGKSTNLHVS